ncbi:MAG: hypothetical protein ABI683_06640 [Ginsengibacter sp.]
MCLVFYLSSCYTPRYVYSPVTQNIPSIEKKNDIEFAANYGTSIDLFRSKHNYNNGLDLHTAWAFNKHFAAMLNENIRWESNGTNDTYFAGDSSQLSYKRNFTEVAAGYFTSMKDNIKMLFQVFSGVAFGRSTIADQFFSSGSLDMKYHQSRVTKLFIQPAFVYKPTAGFSTALSMRFTKVAFSKINTNYTDIELNNYLLDSLTFSPVYWWEPAVTYTFGFKKFPLKFRLQGTISVLLNHRFVEHRTSNIGIGIVYNPLGRKPKMAAPAEN